MIRSSSSGFGLRSGDQVEDNHHIHRKDSPQYMFQLSTLDGGSQTPTPSRPRTLKTRGSYANKSRPAMISTTSHADLKPHDGATDSDAPVLSANWWEPQPRGRARVDRRAASPLPSPIDIPEMETPRPAQLDIGSSIGLGAHLPLHMRSYSPAPPSTSGFSDGPASPAAMFLSAFSSPAPSVRSPSPLPSVISPAMAMFHSPPPAATAPAASPAPLSALPDAGTSIGGYILGPVIGHGGFSTIRTATSEVTKGVVAVKIVPVKSSTPYDDAPRGRVGARPATIGRAATITARGRTPLSSFSHPEPEDDGTRPIAEEAALWSSLSHEHILPLFAAEETLGAWFLFTLYCPAGTLLDLLKRDGQIITPPAPNTTPAKRRPSFASTFASPTLASSARGRSTSISQPAQQRGGLLPETAATLFRQVVRGLRYLHESARVVHCDIKLENVLVDENGGVRIADFGLAVLMDETRVESSVERSMERQSAERGTIAERRSVERKPVSIGLGPAPNLPGIGRANSVSVTGSAAAGQKHKFPPGSLPYAAPELLRPGTNSNQTRGRMGSKSRERGRGRAAEAGHVPHPAQDVWALGCVLHALFTGRLPFSDAFEPRLQMKIVRGIWDETLITALPNSSALLETLRGCLCVSDAQRWTIVEVDERAWAVGVVDEEAEREAARVERRGRGRARGGDVDVFGTGMSREESRGRRGVSVVRERDVSAVRDRSVARDRSVSVVRGRRGLDGSSYSPSPNAKSGGRSVSSGPGEVSVRRGASVTRINSSTERNTQDGRATSVTRKSSLPRNPSLTRSMIPRYGSAAGTNTPPIPFNATPTKRPLLKTAHSFSSTSSSLGAPSLSPGDRVGSSRSSSQERGGRGDSGVGRSPSLDRLGRSPSVDQLGVGAVFSRASSADRLGLDVDRLGRSPPELSPSEGPRTPEEFVARSRSRGRFTAGLEIVDEGEGGAWVEVKGYDVEK